VPRRSTQTPPTSEVETFGLVLPGLVLESVADPHHSNQLRLHGWDGRNFATQPATSHCGRTYTPGLVPSGLAQAVRFPRPSKAFGAAATLANSMLDFLCRYAHLAADAAGLLVGFCLASWFVDCLPVAPVLYLLGPDNETELVLRLLGCLCRRPVLLSDLNVPALATLPRDLDPTLLIGQRNLPRQVVRVLVASNNHRFYIARGRSQLHAYGAKALSANPESVNELDVRVTVSPALKELPMLTDAAERDFADDFQAKLLRYRMVNRQRVSAAQIDIRDFVPAMRDEARAWLAPICDCPDLQRTVSGCLLQQSREVATAGLADDRCLVAEAALFFCHEATTEQFFVGDLAERVNDLLKGRHEDRALTAKKVGLLLRALGIHGERVVKGYRILLTDSVREQIHAAARDYQVPPVQDGVARCRSCHGKKSNGAT
jgi:hypothetical protein